RTPRGKRARKPCWRKPSARNGRLRLSSRPEAAQPPQRDPPRAEGRQGWHRTGSLRSLRSVGTTTREVVAGLSVAAGRGYCHVPRTTHLHFISLRNVTISPSRCHAAVTPLVTPPPLRLLGFSAAAA